MLHLPTHPQAFIDKFRFNAKRASLVQSRIKALERMAEVQVRQSWPRSCSAATTYRRSRYNIQTESAEGAATQTSWF
jgi:ATPase subunit of ABC transporter with duplicated ATPase domains